VARSSGRAAGGDEYRCTWSVADAFTQALSYLRTSTFDSAEWQHTGAMQMAYHAARRGAPAFREMVTNARDMEDIEDGGGAMVNGTQYTNPARISRIRSAW
jgi:hypothetical protein